MGKSDTFRKDTEKGEVVVFKSRSDSHSQTNRSGLTQRNAQISGTVSVYLCSDSKESRGDSPIDDDI